MRISDWSSDVCSADLLVIADMLYLHPEPMPISWQIDGGPGYNAVFGQLALGDLIQAGLVSRSDDGAVRMTDKGLAYAASRLDGPDSSRNYEDQNGRENVSTPITNTQIV